jgi:hypothetical protein
MTIERTEGTVEIVASQPTQLPVAAPNNIVDLIGRMASDPNADIDKFERLLAMKERMEQDEARRAFNLAMRDAQAEMPQVRRDKANTSTGSFYTRLETLNAAVVPIYTKHGFGLSFDTADSPVPNCVRVICHVSHVDGHTELRTYDSPIDDKGIKGTTNKTAAHARSSALSYGRRYITLLIFNVTMAGEDNDGNGPAEIEVISTEQVANLEALLTEVNANRKAFMQHFKIERLDTLPAEYYSAAVKALEQKRKTPPKAAA